MKKLCETLLAACPSFPSILPADVILAWNWDLDCDKQIITFHAPLSARITKRLTDNRMMTGKSADATIMIGYKQKSG